ncbi:hypothetical protein [uncultured Tenacibaculum sp.]|uniref:hypothetical protein n=1 Tax=uncultured Tenacibaculum sp. TaxID=174713 RepID=UPI00263045F7|nr:hypothetical protein [uncultured Tenacibaculum sp.]
MINKEFGSDFHSCNKEFILNKKQNFFFDNKDFSFFLSGRSALYALIKYGVENYGWTKVYIPSYYCQDVIESLSELNIEIVVFQSNPDDLLLNYDFFEDNKTSVFINVNYFGVKKNNTEIFKKIVVVDDLTHCIQGVKESRSDYVFGSLRKQLPIPLGGFLYSPHKLKLPKGKGSILADQAAENKTLGMFLKNEYLQNRFLNKDLYRSYYSKAEEQLIKLYKDYKLPSLAENILETLNVEKILKKKESNIKLALKHLENYLSYLFSVKESSLGLLLLFDSNTQRDFVRRKLIQSNIYPAILWPNQKTDIDINYQNRFLFLHLDYRYSEEDIIYITTELKKSIQECQKQKL